MATLDLNRPELAPAPSDESGAPAADAPEADETELCHTEHAGIEQTKPEETQTQPGPAHQHEDEDPSLTVFGSFWLDGTEFALPVKFIQEMVGEPEAFAAVPLSPPHVLGVFNLRDTIIPVIDMRTLLGFPSDKAPEGRKVAIIEDGVHCIGLLFDESGGVINSFGATRIEFGPNEEGKKDVVVEGMLKLEGGTRMVQILDPYELLKIKRLPRPLKGSARVLGNPKGARRTCIAFQLGHTQCALDVSAVREILDVPEVQFSPLADGHTLGNIELRGNTIPIVDFRGLLGKEEPFTFSQEALSSRKLLILSMPTGPIGLVVYSIDSIMTYFEDDILAFSNVSLPRHDLIKGCLVSDESGIIILLNDASLLDDPAMKLVAQSCQEIYPPKETEDNKALEQRQAIGTGSTYILFSVDVQLAMDAACVSEIMDRPTQLLQPPYALDYVDGILNLRGELITLIKPRVLYNMPHRDKVGSKVLIFHKGDKKYGIVVDSIDEIVNGGNARFTEVPSISNQAQRSISEDVSGCIWIASRGVKDDPFMVLDVDALVARCVSAE